MEADGPPPERKLEPDKPEAFYEAPTTLLGKYPLAAGILLENPKISARELGKKLGIGHDTANRIKQEWAAARPKEEGQPAAEKFFGKGQTLSKAEVEEYSDAFPAALEDHFQAIDEWLWKRQLAAGIDTDGAPVWTNFDEKEMSRLTKLAMRWGQKNRVVAAAVRGTTESADYVAVGSMFLPRFQETVRIYRETKQERPKRRGVRRAED